MVSPCFLALASPSSRSATDNDLSSVTHSKRTNSSLESYPTTMSIEKRRKRNVSTGLKVTLYSFVYALWHDKKLLPPIKRGKTGLKLFVMGQEILLKYPH